MTTGQPPLGGVEPGCPNDWYPLVATNEGWALSAKLGWLYVGSPTWGYSTFMGWTYTAECELLYQEKIGWMWYISGEAETGLWLYSLLKGWIFVTAKDGRFYQYSTDGSTWQWDNFLD